MAEQHEEQYAGSERRRRRRRRYQAVPLPYYMVEVPQPPSVVSLAKCEDQWKFVNAVYNIFVLCTLMGLIYVIMDHHCSTYVTRANLSNVTNHVEQLQHHLTIVKDNYLEIESKISQFSRDLKLEEQLAMFDVKKAKMKKSDMAEYDFTAVPPAVLMSPKRLVYVPKSDVHLNISNNSDTNDRNIVKNYTNIRRLTVHHF